MKRVFKISIAFLLLVAFALPVSAGAYAQGDTNGDGRVNAIDYAMVKRFVLRTVELSEAQFEAADVNGDGKVNAMDYMIVKRVVMKLAEFPCRHSFDEQTVGNLHIFTCKSCGYQYEKFDGELIG